MSAGMRLEPITDPTAWRADALAQEDSWKVELLPAELEALDEGLTACKARGVRPEDVRAGDFPLPAMRERLQGWLDELTRGRGFLLLRGFPVDRYPLEDVRMLYIGLGAHLGTPISQNSFGDLLGDIQDERLKLASGQFEGSRGYRGRGALLFHTDRADIVGLLCVRPAKEGGLSCIMSAMTVYNEFLTRKPHLLPTLYAGFITPNSDEQSDGSLPRSPMFSQTGGVVSCRISRNAVNRGRAAGVPSTPEETEALEFLDELALRDDMRLDMDFRRGDIQFVNNHTILHSRTAYVDEDDPNLRRLLMRLWLRLDQRRPVVPEFFRDYDGIPKTLTRA
jgi:hypothetical protein